MSILIFDKKLHKNDTSQIRNPCVMPTLFILNVNLRAIIVLASFSNIFSTLLFVVWQLQFIYI